MQSWQKQYCKFFIFILTIISAKASASFSCCEGPPVYWGGFYLSGQLGMGSNQEHTKFTNANYFNTLGPVVLGTHFNHKLQGFTAGGALGYNYQYENLVAGIEGGGLTTNFKKTRPSPFFPASDTYTSQLECLASAKARLGYAYEGILTFITGGWAGGHHELKLSDPFSNVFAGVKTWVSGWTVGGGFDCKFSDCLSLGIAYDYVQLQYRNKTAHCPNCGVGVGLGSPQINDRFDIQMLTFRLNYFFYQ